MQSYAFSLTFQSFWKAFLDSNFGILKALGWSSFKYNTQLFEHLIDALFITDKRIFHQTKISTINYSLLPVYIHALKENYLLITTNSIIRETESSHIYKSTLPWQLYTSQSFSIISRTFLQKSLRLCKRARRFSRNNRRNYIKL